MRRAPQRPWRHGWASPAHRAALAAGKLRRPQKALQAALAEETARDWQPGVRARVREQASSSGGLRITTRAHFGFRSALGSTDDPRPRLITQTVSPEHAGRILAARERGATDAELQELVAQAIGYAYFRNFGGRAEGWTWFSPTWSS